jgi:urea carboxylase
MPIAAEPSATIANATPEAPVTATAHGVVSSVPVETGEQVGPGRVLVVVAQEIAA